MAKPANTKNRNDNNDGTNEDLDKAGIKDAESGRQNSNNTNNGKNVAEDDNEKLSIEAEDKIDLSKQEDPLEIIESDFGIRATRRAHKALNQRRSRSDFEPDYDEDWAFECADYQSRGCF